VEMTVSRAKYPRRWVPGAPRDGFCNSIVASQILFGTGTTRSGM
jgi:hypothetical protein